jgi:hypothetical protein
MSTVGNVSATESVSSAQGVTPSNNPDGPNNIDMNNKKTAEYQKTLEKIQKNKDEVIAALKEKIEAPNTTNAQRKELEAKLATLNNVYKHTNYKISADGNITFSFTKGTNINVENFKEAYGIKDGKLRQYLSDRHKEDVTNGYVAPEEANTDEEAQEIIANFQAADIGESVTFTDGFKLTKGRTWWFGSVTDIPDYSDMYLGNGDKITLKSNDI